MVKIKDFVLGVAIAYSTLATYAIVNNNTPSEPEQVYIESIDEVLEDNQIGSFRQNGITYPIFEGPIGPRLGSIEYIGQNLTHSEKILMTEQVLSFFPEVASRTMSDIWDNRGIIANDITRKIEFIIRGEWRWD